MESTLQTAVRPAGARTWITPGDRLAIGLVGCLGIIDWLWCQRAGLAFTGWPRILGAVGLALVLRLVYCTVRRNAPIAEMALYTGLWILFTAFGAILTYLGAALAEPLSDAGFTQADAWLGFQWLDWVRFVQDRPLFKIVLEIAYDSLMAQIVGSIILFALLRDRRRNAGLLLSIVAGLCITTALFTWLPALGPCVASGRAADFPYLDALLRLRRASQHSYNLGAMQGIISFPSFHATLAVLLAAAHRGIRWSFPLIGCLNLLMLVSIAPIGGHYLTDILGGIVVAAIAWLIVRRLLPDVELA